jgi:hypothetical protein
VMGKRNYCMAERDEATGDLIFEIRVEKNRGEGETVG